MDKTILSVIIPCYNSGNYLIEAIESVKLSKGDYNYEIIIIDDGSTDIKTLELLKEIRTENIKVIYQENNGPASARNSGIRQAQSEFLLFLDSDNKIKPGFINSAVGILEANPLIDIVHGKPEFFGEINANRTFKTGKFELDKMWLYNYIDMCSVVRKSLFDSIGLLDENQILIGHEDWEFWIRAGVQNKKFYYIDEVVFDYRIRNDSLVIKAGEQSKYEKMVEYLYGKNYKYFQSSLATYHETLIQYNNLQQEINKEKNSPIRTFLKNLYQKYHGRSQKD